MVQPGPEFGCPKEELIINFNFFQKKEKAK